MPELGGDSTLTEPVRIFAGGSTINTATHLRMLSSSRYHWESNDNAAADPSENPSEEHNVVVQTMLNPKDEYGKILLRHALAHNFEIVNCCSVDRLESSDAGAATPHCVVIVSDQDRSFMTHRGCSETFTALDLQLDDLMNTDGPVHLHVAGFFCTPGFGDGSLKEQLVRFRTKREQQWPNEQTAVSLVTQFDVTQAWNGGLDEIVPLLSCLIMNELEANKVLERARGRANEKGMDPTGEWISFFSSLNPNAIFVVTKGVDGAIAFRNEKPIGSVGPAVAVDVVDPTGAGDAFAAGFLHGLWSFEGPNRGGDWSDEAVNHALSWGCAVGTAAVTVRGASIPSSAQLIADLNEKQKAAVGTH